MAHRVLMTRRIPACAVERIETAATCEVWPGSLPPERDELLDLVAGCSGLVTLLSDRIDEELMDAAGPSLKVIANYAVGVNNIDLQAAQRRQIAVGNTPDVLTDATADLAVALLLAAARRFPEAIENVARGGWKSWEPLGFIGADLVGKTIGIVGMGRIGMAVARRLHFGWSMRVLYTARGPKPAADDQLAAKRVDLETLLAESDFVSLHCPLTEQTRGLIDKQAFNQMQSHAVLVNTSRGEVVDQEAMIEALDRNQIFAAGLDVTTPEPIGPEHPLVKLKNCVVLPHIGSASHGSRNAMANIVAENILAGIDGKPLPHAVHP